MKAFTYERAQSAEQAAKAAASPGTRFIAGGTNLLDLITRDESRHSFFYYRQADLRLRRPAVARIARLLVDRFWAPVGSGVQPQGELRFMAGYLFADAPGRAAARKADETIRKLPGFTTVRLLEDWLDRFANGGTNGNRDA